MLIERNKLRTRSTSRSSYLIRLTLHSLHLHYRPILHIHPDTHALYQLSDLVANYRSATTIPATPSTPGSAVAKAPESVTLLATELAAEAALLLALLAAFEADELPLLDDEVPLLEDELSELVPEELEPLVLEALEPEEVEELPPVMLLRIEPGWLLVLVKW
jgi:hypothetical protein